MLKLFCNIISSKHKIIWIYDTTLNFFNKFSYYIILSFKYDLNNGYWMD